MSQETKLKCYQWEHPKPALYFGQCLRHWAASLKAEEPRPPRNKPHCEHGRIGTTSGGAADAANQPGRMKRIVPPLTTGRGLSKADAFDVEAQDPTGSEAMSPGNNSKNCSPPPRPPPPGQPPAPRRPPPPRPPRVYLRHPTTCNETLGFRLCAR